MRFINEYDANNSHMRNLAMVYDKDVEFHGLNCKILFYVFAQKRPKIPSPDKIGMLFNASCSTLNSLV